MSHDQLIAAIRQREKQTEFGYGVQIADRYVKNMQQLAGLDLCYRYAATRKMSFDDVMKKAANTLVYSNEDMLIEEKASGVNARIDNIELPKNTLMVFKHVLTTPRKDRDGDVLRTEGAIVDPRMLLLWQHVHTLPIGKMLAVSEHNSKRLTLFSCIVDINELAHDAAVMVDNDMARFSHGFRALEYSQLKESEGSTTGDGGFDIKRFEIMEESIVSVPSNADAEVNEVIVELVEGGKLTSDLMKEVGRSMRREMPLLVASGISLVAENKHVESETKGTIASPEKAQDNGAKGKGSDEEKDSCPQVPQVKTVSCRSKGFNVELEHLEASRLEYEWASRWLDCQIKEMQVVSTFVPSFRKGSFLTGLKHEESQWALRDTRNLTRDGKEEPPCYEVIQLNSKLSDTFLTGGLKFFQANDGTKICVKYSDCYGGLLVTTYVKQGTALGNDTIDKAWDFAQKHNFLKGESFSLSGEFLKKGSTQWDDVFLEKENKQALQRTVRLLNEQQDKMPNRGVIVLGPPGTGKTLAGRVILNDAKASFIWVAAKDFWRMGAVDGLCAAFELANELAPAVIFMEDIDNWISSYAIDVIKTEMDGIGKSTGVVTIMTTNFPERFPDALIDRPGRFHDVLEFNLPTATVRREMLSKWTNNQVKSSALDSIVQKTEGYSGAHLYELVYYATTLQSEQKELGIDAALLKAIEKIDSQRALLNQSQLSGSNFRDVRDCPAKVKEYMATVLKESATLIESKVKSTAVADEKAGRTLSAANLKTITDVCDDLKSIMDSDKNLSRGSQAICERCVGRLEKLVESVKPDESEEETEKEVTEHVLTIKEAMAFILSNGSDADRTKLLGVLQIMEAARKEAEAAKEYYAIFA